MRLHVLRRRSGAGTADGAVKLPKTPWALGFATFALGLIAATAVARWQETHNREVAAQRFDELARQVTNHIAARVQGYSKGLRGIRGAVVVNGGTGLDRAQMRAYSATIDLEGEFPGARGFGVIRRVTPGDQTGFVARKRADGWPDFKVRQFAPHDRERHVVEAIEPLELNQVALGLDLSSEPLRRRALTAAMRSGLATLSGPLRLVQASGPEAHGFILALPIYRRDASLADVHAREAATTGWAYAPLMIGEVLHGVDQDEALYNLTLRDLDPDDGSVFHDTTDSARIAAGGPRARIVLPVFGRSWEATLRASPAFMESLDQRDPVGVGAALATMAALIAALVIMIGQGLQRRRRMLLEVARRAAIVDSSEDAVIAGTLEGEITEWNAGAERLFGLSAAQALGCPAASLLLPPDRHQEDADIRATIARGERVMPIVTTRCHANGSLIDVSLTASPIFDDTGRCIGFAKIMRDISARLKAQRDLAELNAHLEAQVADRTAKLDAARHTLQAILDAMPSQIGYWDRDLRNQVANRAYRDWFGVEPEHLRGRHMSELLGEKVFKDSSARLQAALAGEAQTFHGLPIPRPDGQGNRESLVNYLPDIVDGEVRGIFTLVHDITELVEGRLALAAAQRAQAALLQTLDQHSIVSVADRRGNIISVNEAFCRISGYSESELIGQNHRIVNSGQHDKAFWNTMWRTVAGGQSWRGEVCNRAKGGALYWVDSVVAPFLDAHGRVEKYVSIRTDITPIKRLQQEAEAARREAEHSSRFLREVLEAATQFSIVACKPDGTVSVFNRGAERLLGHKAADVVGRASALSFHEPRELEERARTMAARLGHPVHPANALIEDAGLDQPQEWTYVRKDGSSVPVNLAVTAMRDGDGRPLGYLGIAYDISSRLQHEESLRRAVHEARRANEAKSSFLANMSHEIRTPMNAVIGLTHVLEGTRLDADQAATLAKVKLAGQALLAIINDVLDLSKFEAGEMRLERAPFSLPTLLREVTQLLSVQAESRGIELRLEEVSPLPGALEGDATRLRQVLTNLLSNAIKFTERGSVRLEVRGESADAAARLHFAVIDTGVGIAPEALERLFNPFVQADSSTTRRFGGTGLGLSIVKQLVEMMDGQVGVRSTPGEGSEFRVELSLPLAAPGATVDVEYSQPDGGADLRGVRLLVVDDNPVNLEVARRILTLAQAQVSETTDGQQAVDLLMARPDGFDAVLMDVQMPVLDGLDATRRIRSALGLTRLPIIGLTAGVSTAEARRARAAGMTEVMGKPFDPMLLVRCIRRVLGRAEPDPAVAHEPVLPDTWPHIAGIDSADVARRLAGDTTLLRSMLRRLLRDFADLASVPTCASNDIATLAARMHNLKGVAGTLGARNLAEAAARGEKEARAGAPAATTLASVGESLRALTQASADFLANCEVAAPETAGEALDTTALREVKEKLARFDLSAMDGFSALAPALRRQLGAAQFELLREQVDSLQFDVAARTLEAFA